MSDPGRSLGTYRLSLARAGGPPLHQWAVPVGSSLLWEEIDVSLERFYPSITLEYTPSSVDPWAEVERLRAALKELEWDKHDATCPVCDARQPQAIADHKPDCWLAAELGKDAPHG